MPKEPKTTKKRASKVKNESSIVAFVNANGDIQGSFTPEPKRPLIAHLPFRTTEVQFHDGPLIYDPRPPVVPEPYEADNMFSSNSELIEQEVPVLETSKQPMITETADLKANVTEVEQPVKVFTTMNIMIEYRVANETQTLPESVEAACFWCAGTFEGRPIVIPTLEEEGIYKVYGNFCTLSCALSFLLNEHIDPQVRWERQALLHRMYKQSSINPAPPKESLKMFGGALSYDQYRNIIQQNKMRIDCHLPPVISILATLDTKPIDFYEISFKNTTTNGSQLDAIKTVESGLRLKRSKPLKDKESTLDAVMNLQVKVR
jgi:hypothetical protein